MARALIIEIFGDAKQFGAELDRAAGKTRQFGAAAKVAGVAIAAGLAVGLEKSVKSAVDFQSSMQLLTTQAGVSEKSLGQLKQGVLALAGPTATAPEELSKGIYHLASQGLRGAQALDALKIAAEGAKVGQANLEDVTNALGAVIVSRIGGVKNLKGAMGDLNATVGAGDMRMQDLADAMGTGLAANAKIAGVSLAQVSAALAVFGDNNIRGAKAGTLLSSTMRVMGHQSAAAVAALNDIGVSSDVLQQKLSTEGLTGAIDYLKSSIANTHKPLYQVSSDLSEAFGGKQATGIKLLLDESDRLHNKLAEVQAGANGFGQAWQQTSQTTAFKFDQMKAAVSSVAINLGSALLPAVTKAANAIANMTGYLEKHQSVARVAAVAIGVLAAALIAVTSPVTAVILAIGALSIALGVAWAKSSEFRDITLGAWKAISDWSKTNWPEIKRIIVTTIQDTWAIVKGVIAVFKAGWDEFGTTIKTIARNDFQTIEALVRDVATVIRGVANIIKGIAHGDWSQAWQGLKQVVSGVFGGIYDILRGEGKNLAAILGLIGHAMGQAFKAAMNGVAAVARAGVDGAFIEPINAIISAIDAIHLPAVGFSIFGHHVGFGGWGGFKIPQVPMLAEGGIVTSPTLALIGEAGPEAVVPLDKGMGGPNITVNVGPVNGTADPAFAKVLASQLATQLRAGRAPQLQQAIQAI